MCNTYTQTIIWCVSSFSKNAPKLHTCEYYYIRAYSIEFHADKFHRTHIYHYVYLRTMVVAATFYRLVASRQHSYHFVSFLFAIRFQIDRYIMHSQFTPTLILGMALSFHRSHTHFQIRPRVRVNHIKHILEIYALRSDFTLENVLLFDFTFKFKYFHRTGGDKLTYFR